MVSADSGSQSSDVICTMAWVHYCVNHDLQDRPDFTEVLSVLEGRSAVQSVHQLKPKSQVIFTVNTLDLNVCVSVTIMDVRCLGEGGTDWTTDASDCRSCPQTCTNMVPMLFTIIRLLKRELIHHATPRWVESLPHFCTGSHVQHQRLQLGSCSCMYALRLGSPPSSWLYSHMTGLELSIPLCSRWWKVEYKVCSGNFDQSRF